MTELERRQLAWRAAVAVAKDDSSCRAFEAEQRAYDALIEYVEDNGLNYTDADPRPS